MPKVDFCQKCNLFQGGGGYAGGNVNSSNGEGGTSYVDTARTHKGLAKAQAGYNAGPGYVMIIPAIEGCNCDYLCVALDEKRSETACICPESWLLADQKSCIREYQLIQSTRLFNTIVTKLFTFDKVLILGWNNNFLICIGFQQ